MRNPGRAWNWVTIGFASSALAACGIVFHRGGRGGEKVETIEPLAVLNASSNPATELPFAIDPFGVSPGANWGTGPAQFGAFTYDSAARAVQFMRNAASSNAFYDVNWFPNDENLRLRFGSLREISAKFRIVLHDAATFNTACGFLLGFGQASPPHPQAGSMPLNLRLQGRDWTGRSDSGSGVDFIRFGYQANYGAGATEYLQVDVAPNAYSRGGAKYAVGYNYWARTRFSGAAFAMQDAASRMDAVGEWMEFTFKIQFDPTSSLVTLTLTPLASSNATGSWKAQTVSWDYSKPVGYTVGGQPRDGIDLNDIPATGSSITLSQLHDETVALGFYMTGLARECVLSEMTIKKVQ